MKKLIFATILIISSLAQAYDFELAVIAGAPDQKLAFVSDILKERNTLVDSKGSDISTYTNGIFYFAWKNHIQTAASIEILAPNGGASYENLIKGVNQTASRSAITLVPVGPNPENICQLYASYPDTVFLIGLGSDATEVDDGNMPSCHSPNILFVVGLNKELTDISRNQSWGKLARLAVPHESLSGNPIDHRVSRSHGLAVAAGKMSALLRANPELRGVALVEKFLGEATVYLPALEGKVTGARALVDYEK